MSQLQLSYIDIYVWQLRLQIVIYTIIETIQCLHIYTDESHIANLFNNQNTTSIVLECLLIQGNNQYQTDTLTKYETNIQTKLLHIILDKQDNAN